MMPKSTAKMEELLESIREGNVTQLEKLLKEGIDVNAEIEDKTFKALHLAAKEGNADIVKVLIDIPSTLIDIRSKTRCTPLHTASLSGHQKIVEMLLEANANVNAQSQDGFTALYMAAQENHTKIVKLLLEKRADQSLATTKSVQVN